MENPPSSSDFGQLRAFTEVASLGSFSRAAAAMGVSASALSQTIRALETHLGVRLLHRATRSVSLTEADENLLARVRPALAELGTALNHARQNRATPAGMVRVHSFRFPPGNSSVRSWPGFMPPIRTSSSTLR